MQSQQTDFNLRFNKANTLDAEHRARDLQRYVSRGFSV